jgi:hypothetical protein
MFLKNGFIYQLVKWTLIILNRLNLVELFKFIGRKINPEKQDVEKCFAYERTTADIFIVLKWIFILIVWYRGYQSHFATFFVWYLIGFNLYTYFYFHIWHDNALKTDEYDKDRIRRRFINLMLAIAYSLICFAYLYYSPYAAQFTWSVQPRLLIHSLLFSISSAFAANYTDVAPATTFGNIVMHSELVITFIFVTVVLSRSLPQTNSQQ